MRPFWTQTAAGALVGAVVLGLVILPGRLLAPESRATPLALPRSAAAEPVEALPAPVVRPKPRPAPHAPRIVAFAVAAATTAPTPLPAPAPAPRPRPARQPRHVAP